MSKAATRTPRGRRPGTRAADDSGTHVWLLLMKAHRSLARHAARSIGSLGLCISDFAILEALLHKGPLPVNELGRRIELTSGSITTAVDRLAARALVTRAAAPHDRRARIVHLTREGEARIAEAFAQHKRSMDRTAGGLSRAERATLVALLKTLGLTADAQFAAHTRAGAAQGAGTERGTGLGLAGVTPSAR